jgi:hypothetical protein
VRTISLWQPWATLVAVGAKRIETRHWHTPPALIGQRIGIHAAKTTQHLPICAEWPFNVHVKDRHALPLGAVVATAVLDRCRPITSEGAALLEERDREEAAFGLYTPGRFAWVLEDVVALTEPVPFRGSQGFFDVPDEALGLEPPQRALL